MTQTFFPFDSGPGANATEAQWSNMAQHWLSTGVIRSVLNELQVFADSTGLQVKVKSGGAWIKGHYFESDAEEILAISTADPSNPRVDRVIVRLDWTSNTIQLAVLQGVAAASPVAPALTQNTSRWEIPLAQIRVNAGASTIAADDVTDERTFAQQPYLISQGYDERTEIVEVTFNPDGSSPTVSSSGTFSKAFASVPSVSPMNIVSQTSSYSDSMKYPFIYSITTTGFLVKLGAIGGNFGAGTIKMKFLVIGK